MSSDCGRATAHASYDPSDSDEHEPKWTTTTRAVTMEPTGSNAVALRPIPSGCRVAGVLYKSAGGPSGSCGEPRHGTALAVAL
jgi:hypothetical protein